MARAVVLRSQCKVSPDRGRTALEQLLVRSPRVYRMLARLVTEIIPRCRLRRLIIRWQNRAGLSSITRRDYELTMVRYHPDVKYEVDDRFQVLGLPAKLTGREAIIEALKDWAEEWDRWELAPIALVELEDCLLGLGRFVARGRASGIEIDVEYAQVITLRGGLVIHEHDFVEWDEALRAAGLDPVDFHALLRPEGAERDGSRAYLARRESTEAPPLSSFG